MIEYRILFIYATCINLLLFVGTFIYWRVLKTYPGWGLWIVSTGLVTLVNISITLQGTLDPLMLNFIGNALTILVAWIRLEAFNRIYDHKERLRLQLPVVFFGFLFLFFSVFIWHNVFVRTVAMTFTLAFFLLKISLISIYHAAEISKPISRVVCALCAVLAISLFYRAVDWFIFPSHQGLLVPVFANVQFAIVFLVLENIFTAVYLVLNGQRLMRELTTIQKKLAELASTDPLTGLLNRRMIFELGEVEFARARRYSHPLSLILFDFDDFKQVNDSLGHAGGDYVLKTISAACLEDVRQSEILGRLGGDEFVIILPETEIGGARATAERLCQKIKSIPLMYNQCHIYTTISVGVAQLSDQEMKFDELLYEADIALYREKKSEMRIRCKTGKSPITLELENGVSF